MYSNIVFYEPLYSFSYVTLNLLSNCHSKRQEANALLLCFFARITSHEYIVHISIYSLSHYHLLHKSRKLSLKYGDHILLFRPTNAQYINSHVYCVKYSDMFWCIYIIFRESFPIYAKITISIKLIQLKCLGRWL